MSNIESIKAEIMKLSRPELKRLSAWLTDHLEQSLELNPAFVAKIERGNRELAQGLGRIVKR